MLGHHSSANSWFHGVDAFRSLPKDVTEASATGAVMTIVAAVTCLVLFFCEASAFITAKPVTRIVIDSNQDALLQINFDVMMMDMNCDYITVGVWDAFGTEKMNITKNVQKQRIDHKGSDSGHAYNDDEIAELEFSDKSFTKEELEELDSDWGSSSDNFKHDNFQGVINAHDFTLVNFYADWCPHCRQFAPIFTGFEKQINEKEVQLKDVDGQVANVRVLKINCVDFEEACMEQRVRAFPSIRFYIRGQPMTNHKEYMGRREAAGMMSFLTEEVAKRHTHVNATYHDIFGEGCRISGKLEVARVPGTVHFQAMHTAKKTLNLAFTNVSHKVNHFSFGKTFWHLVDSMPSEFRKHTNPLDGRTFASDKFHKAPHHFIKVVYTSLEGTSHSSYQQTHQWSVRTLQRNTIPQAKFSYDLSPVEVVVSKGERRWYDFVTQVFAIVGGAFSVMSMATGVLKLTGKSVKNAIQKLS